MQKHTRADVAHIWSQWIPPGLCGLRQRQYGEINHSITLRCSFSEKDREQHDWEVSEMVSDILLALQPSKSGKQAGEEKGFTVAVVKKRQVHSAGKKGKWCQACRHKVQKRQAESARRGQGLEGRNAGIHIKLEKSYHTKKTREPSHIAKQRFNCLRSAWNKSFKDEVDETNHLQSGAI